MRTKRVQFRADLQMRIIQASRIGAWFTTREAQIGCLPVGGFSGPAAGVVLTILTPPPPGDGGRSREAGTDPEPAA